MTYRAITSDNAFQRCSSLRAADQHHHLRLTTALKHNRTLRWQDQLGTAKGATTPPNIGSAPGNALPQVAGKPLCVTVIVPSVDLRATGQVEENTERQLIGSIATRYSGTNLYPAASSEALIWAVQK